MRTYAQACPACNGSGRSKYAIATGSTTDIGQVRYWQPLPCSVCNGLGVQTLYIWEIEDFEEVRRLLDGGGGDASHA